MTEVYHWHPDVEAVEMEGRWVILQAARHTITNLDQVGGFIWSLLQDEQDETSIVKALTDKYDVDTNRAETDLRTFLGRLKALDVIVTR